LTSENTKSDGDAVVRGSMAAEREEAVGVEGGTWDGVALDSGQLSVLERSFRDWAEGASPVGRVLPRQRLLLIFLLIRYTGAKLSEVLALDLSADIDPNGVGVWLGGKGKAGRGREVQISEALAAEIRNFLAQPAFRGSRSPVLAVDPGFVRRRFYERAQACGFSKRLGSPEMIRRARAAELMQADLPLSVVQEMLGYVRPRRALVPGFTLAESQRIARLFMERESGRKTSARNAFFGKISALHSGEVQTQVELTTMGGQRVTSVITRDSEDRLGLRRGRLVTAEIKATSVMLERSTTEPRCSAENRFLGTVTRLIEGKVTTECVVRIASDLEVCAVISAVACRRLAPEVGVSVWVLFSSFAVVLRVD